MHPAGSSRCPGALGASGFLIGASIGRLPFPVPPGSRLLAFAGRETGIALTLQTDGPADHRDGPCSRLPAPQSARRRRSDPSPPRFCSQYIPPTMPPIRSRPAQHEKRDTDRANIHRHPHNLQRIPAMANDLHRPDPGFDDLSCDIPILPVSPVTAWMFAGRPVPVLCPGPTSDRQPLHP